MDPQCEVDCCRLCGFVFLGQAEEPKYCWGIENSPNNDYAVVLLWLPEIICYLNFILNDNSDRS